MSPNSSRRAASVCITSPANPVFKTALALATSHGRKKHGLSLVEGLRAVEGSLEAGTAAGFALATPEALSSPRGRELAKRLLGAGIPLYEMDKGLFSRVTQTETPQGFALACALREAALEEALRAEFVVVADCVQDPGNLGAIVRSARAFGVGAILATAGTADAANPKVLRASAGTLPGFPFSSGHDPALLAAKLAGHGFRLVVADAKGKRDFREEPWNGRVALVIGSEAHGVDPAFLGIARARLCIPLAGGVESLNAAAAAAILLAEAARRRAVR